MKNFRRHLPPLDYLLFFEAVARHGNFTRAASELNVSQAAVSKRIKSLEIRLGLDLVARNGRTVTLTSNGRKLAASASEALDYLNTSLMQIRQDSEEKLSLASNVAVSQFWLTPRINDYLLSQSSVPVTLTASDRDVDLFNQENDVIIYYGLDIPKGWDGDILFEEVWLPVVSPDLMNGGTGIGGLTLLDFEKLTPKWINWPDFIEITKHEEFATAERVTLGSYGSSLDAAIRGKGIALGCPEILRYEIAAKRLMPLEDYQITTGRSYFAICKSGNMSQRTRDLLKDVEIRQ